MAYYSQLHVSVGSRHSAVSIANGYGLDNRAVGVKEFWQGQKFSLLHIIQTGSGAHPPPIP
jgi:hypothetical protein